MSGTHKRAEGEAALTRPGPTSNPHPVPAGATPNTSDHTRLGGADHAADGGAEDGSRHDPRHQLGLAEQPATAMHALAVALLLDMSNDQLFDALREVLVLHGIEPLVASTGAGVSPCAPPVEAHTQDP